MVILTTVTKNTWIPATWDEFSALVKSPAVKDSDKTYYDSGLMRMEEMPIGSAHGRDNLILAAVISLYGTVKGINYVSFADSNFQKLGERECQPDLAYYIGETVQCPPKNNQAVNIATYGPPTLAIEIAASTLNDDLGNKRLLYERLNAKEYWVVDVESAKVIAFEIANGGSRQIQVSSVLPGLSMSIIEEALERSKTENDGTINRWLLKAFS